jgi:glycosyltransferase involved in cell wall biosynthesis
MLSIIILTKNSEETLADTLESLKSFGDEIIIIDSNSDDRTVEIAEHLGAKVYKHEFIDFATQRNYAISKASGDWVLYLDDDEEATPEFKKEVGRILEDYDKGANIGGYFIYRKTYYFGKDWGFTDRVQRLFYKNRFVAWEGVVHETPKIKGEFGQVENPINHYTHRNLTQMLAKTNEWSEFEANLRFKSGHPQMSWWRFVRVMATAFISSYFFNKGYRNRTEGFIEAVFQSYSMFITYAKLWEKQKNNK